MLGWASELPILVKMNDLPKSQQPRSDDPEFWNVWTGKEKRNIDWNTIAGNWQGGVQNSEKEEVNTGSESRSDSIDKNSINEPNDDVPF